MPFRQFYAFAALIIAAIPVQAAQYRTQNFLVDAPNPQIAQQFGQMAEHYRKQKAIEWIGREMEPWPQPCPLYVRPDFNGAGGATKFDYRGGNYAVLSMELSGPLERMLNSVLPHEVTHTVFAHHFRYPVPRWADEGGAVLSEDEVERSRHDHLCRQKLNAHQKMPLRRLFNLKEYDEAGGDVMIIYAEGFSVSSYLVEKSDRATFLNFVAMGMRNGWDHAAQTYYGYQTVEQMEESWLQYLIATRDGARRQPNGTMIATNPQSRGSATALNRDVVRLTAPPAQPQLDPAGPIVRGQAADEQRRARPVSTSNTPAGVVPLGPKPQGTQQPATIQKPRPMPPPVTLGLPELAPMPQAAAVKPNGPSPVGFQN
jgi:hypothetical protein